MKKKLRAELLGTEENKSYEECDPCFQPPQEEKKEKTRKPEEKSWISLGNRMFFIEDVQSMYIQANHLIINFDYTEKQIVIHFGYGPEGEKNAKIVFESIREMYGAYKIELPEKADLYPDLMKTVYGDQIDRRVQDGIKMEKDKIKKRYQTKYDKLIKEMEKLKEKIKKDVSTI